MHGDGVRRKSIQHQEVERAIRRVGQRQTGVAQNDAHLGLAVGHEGKKMIVHGDAIHHRIDFVIGDGLARLAIGSQGTGPEPDDADILQNAGFVAIGENLPDRPLR